VTATHDVPPPDSAATTLVLDAQPTARHPQSTALPPQEPPPPPTLIAAAEPTAHHVPLPPAQGRPAAAPRAPRPGIPLPMVLGGAGLGLVVVALAAWALRPPAPAAEAPARATLPPAAAGSVTAAPAANAGSLRVESEPAGARVLVNGQARGRSPLELAELAFGSYEVRVEQAGYEAERRSVELSAASPAAELQVTLKRRAVAAAGAADFVSTPAGATVSVDGKAAGTTPLRGFKLPPGRRRVEIALDGHETWSSTLDVVAGETGRIDVRLRSTPAPKPTPEPVDVTRVYRNEAGEVDTLARRLSGSSPSYPSGRAPRLRSGQRVSVLLRFVVTDAGEVADVVVVESAGKAVDDVVVAAVKTWKYEPATRRGVRVKVETTFRQTFLGA
jgi:TonB family protein